MINHSKLKRSKPRRKSKQDRPGGKFFRVFVKEQRLFKLYGTVWGRSKSELRRYLKKAGMRYFKIHPLEGGETR